MFKFIYELKQIFIWLLFGEDSLDRAMESLEPVRVVSYNSVPKPRRPPLFPELRDSSQGSTSRCTPISKIISEGFVSPGRGVKSSAR